MYVGKESKTGGPTKDTLLACIKQDIARLVEDEEALSLPEEGLPQGNVLGVDTEYLGRGGQDLLTVSVADGSSSLTWDSDIYTIGVKEVLGVKEVPLQSGSGSKGFPDGIGVTTPSRGCTSLGGIKGVLEGVKGLVLHNAPDDIKHLWENRLIPQDKGWLTGDKVIDTLILTKTLYEDWPSYKLEDILATNFTVKGWKYRTKDIPPEKWEPKERADRCALDAWAGYVLAKKNWPLLTPAQRELYYYTNRVGLALHRASVSGAIIDLNKFNEIKKDAEGRYLGLRDRLVKAGLACGMGGFDPGNDHHLRELLFDTLGFSPVSFTPKTGEPAVARADLEELARSDCTPGEKHFLEGLVEYSKAEKIYSTYTGVRKAKSKKKSLPELMFPLTGLEGITGEVAWLPFSFNVMGAKTGRRSSSNPNSQNWPKSVRQMVRSRWPEGLIVAADYRKLEPRILAYLSGCTRMMEWFTTGGGYIDIARELFQKEVKEGTLEYRGVKSIVLGVHYDMRTPKMAEELWKQKIHFSADWKTHVRETGIIRDAYLGLVPELEEYMAAKREEVLATGQVVAPDGRVRHVGKLGAKHADNQAINFPVQETASAITGSALVDVEAAVLAYEGIDLPEWYNLLLADRRNYLTEGSEYGRLTPNNDIPRVINEVHDELTSDCPKEKFKVFEEIVVESMRAVKTLREFCPYFKDLPLDVDLKAGSTWGL